MEEKSSIGLSPNLTAVMAYIFGFVSGLIIFILEKDNRYVRFHSMQSILLSLFFIVLSFIAGLIPVVGIILGLIISVASIICWLIAIINAAQGNYYKFPLIGDYAEQQI